MKKRSDFVGTELDWFAADSDGFVALMSSAGYGPIPDCVFERFDDQRRIEEFLARLVGDSLMPWERMILSLSTSGMFVYDWEHWDGPYRRQGVPSVPQRLDELGIPAELRESFAVVPERFSASATLRPELLLKCVGSSRVDLQACKLEYSIVSPK